MPRIVDRNKRRQETVAGLFAVIAERGMEAVSVRSVIAQTSWSRGLIDHYFVNFEELVLLGLRTFSKKAERRAVRVRKGRCGAAALRALLLEFMPLDERRRHEGRIWFGFLSRAAAEAAPGLDRGAALDSLLAFELAATVQAILDGGVDEALLERRAEVLLEQLGGEPAGSPA